MSNERSSFVFNTAIFVLLFSYVIFVFNNIVSDTWNQQAIGNYFHSSQSAKEKRALGNANCDCQHITLLTKEKVEKGWARVRSYLLSPELSTRRILHFLTGSVNPYWLNGTATVVVPKMGYNKGKLYTDTGMPQRVKVKMTGGLKDHFDTETFSLRLKSDSSIISSINKVNFYNPKVRLGGLHEWFTHELLLDAGLIPLRTGYVNLKVNEREGIYFYQEQPSMDMLNDLKYKEGLIVRIINTVSKESSQNIAFIDGVYDKKSLPIKVFEKQIELLKNKLIDYNAGLITARNLYSIPKLAKLGAVIDLAAGYHGIMFKNMYFYFNPDNLLLEPIAREFQTIAYTTTPNSGFFSMPEAVRFQENRIINGSGRFIINSLVLNWADAKYFEQHYYKHLSSISSKAYLDSVFSKVSSELKNRQNCLFLANPEFPAFDKQFYYTNQSLVNDYLNGQN